MVPDLDPHAGIISCVEGEGLIPRGMLATELADTCAVLLSAEVDLHVGVLSRRRGYHFIDEFCVVGEVGVDGSHSDRHGFVD